MIVNLVNKYGMVPKSVYGEAHSSTLSRPMNQLVTNKLRQFAAILRRMKGDGASDEALQAEKATMMNTILRILTVCLGSPPTEFDWSFCECWSLVLVHACACVRHQVPRL